MIENGEAHYSNDEAFEIEEVLDSTFNAENFPGKVKFKQKYDVVGGEKVHRYKKPKFIKVDGAAALDFEEAKTLASESYSEIPQDEIDSWTKSKDVTKYLEDTFETYIIAKIEDI